jgi:hypothetical protein
MLTVLSYGSIGNRMQQQQLLRTQRSCLASCHHVSSLLKSAVSIDNNGIQVSHDIRKKTTIPLLQEVFQTNTADCLHL